MKKKILTLLLTVTALGVIPFSVYASDTDTNQTNECKEVITNQKIINEKNADGTITQAGLVTFEYQPISSDLKAGGCSTCLLYTSPSPRDRTRSRMPSSA